MKPTRQQLERELQELQRKLDETKLKLSALEGGQSRPGGSTDTRSDFAERTSGRRPVRDVVLDSLLDFGMMAYSQQLAIYARARYGRPIPATRFGTLSKDEEKAARAGRTTREVWLCHGLTFDRGEPIRRLWARSDWPLHERIVAPTTGRVMYLKMTARLAKIALDDQTVAAEPEMLKYLVADHARDLGLPFRRGEFPLDVWHEKALAELRLVEEDDRKTRMQAAERLGRELHGVFQLFGKAPRPIALPGDLEFRKEG